MCLCPTLSTPFEIIGLIDTDEIALSNKFKRLQPRLLNVGMCDSPRTTGKED
jgi:hypothetical protein